MTRWEISWNIRSVNQTTYPDDAGWIVPASARTFYNLLEPCQPRGGKMVTLNMLSVEKEEDDATRAPESGDKQPERDK